MLRCELGLRCGLSSENGESVGLRGPVSVLSRYCSMAASIEACLRPPSLVPEVTTAEPDDNNCEDNFDHSMCYPLGPIPSSDKTLSGLPFTPNASI